MKLNCIKKRIWRGEFSLEKVNLQKAEYGLPKGELALKRMNLVCKEVNFSWIRVNFVCIDGEFYLKEGELQSGEFDEFGLQKVYLGMAMAFPIYFDRLFFLSLLLFIS